MFSSYAALAKGLVAELDQICLLDGSFTIRGRTDGLDVRPIAKWIGSLGWEDANERSPAATAQGRQRWVTAIPLEQSDGTLLGVFVACQSVAKPPAQPSRFAADLARRLKPLLDCVHRDFAAAVPVRTRVQNLTERTAELEWLFKITSNLKGAPDDQKVIEELLGAATVRLMSALGVLCVPDKRLTIIYEREKGAHPRLLDAWNQTQQHLLTWVQRQNRPLIINGVGRSGRTIIPCKVLCVPVVRESGRVIGALAFYNSPQEPDYLGRHSFLARHLGRQVASIVEAQFDLMTGLYTRTGLDQMCSVPQEESDFTERSIIYLDIDHMHVANELHGFEVGNELIVRVADLLAPPLLPEGALAARISGDRFAVVLPASSCDEAAHIAAKLTEAATKLVIGPTDNAVDISISCGISTFLPMPDGLARAIAAAELACKTAKSRGRNRVELYALEDGSMMRRHNDAIAVGQLRSALKSDRLLLYAQRITPLKDPSHPGGYELLLRLRDVDGTLMAPGPLIEAAQRYQLLPAVDRWVIKRALQMLAPYRGMFRTRGLGISINVSGQSIGDETFIQQFTELLKSAQLPPNCIGIELTEQAAIRNLAKATQMVDRLRALGCPIALDDFGTGANSLTYLKALHVTRVKIDGSFVRDIVTDRNSKATVRSIVELAKGLSIETVAEYVETHAIAAELQLLGVDYAQGYAYGKPAPLDEILESLVQDESRRLHRLFLES